SLSVQRDEISRALADVAQGRLLGGQGWEERLVHTLVGVVEGRIRHITLVSAMAQLARLGGMTGLDVCHEVLTKLRVETLRRLAKDDPSIPRLEDTFQEARLAVANVSLFFEREHQAAQALHLRVITRACLDRAQGADLGELAVALDEQLPLFGIRHFVISQGPSDQLKVIARSDKSHDASENVLMSDLGRDEALKAEAHVVVQPLPPKNKPGGLARRSSALPDPFVTAH